MKNQGRSDKQMETNYKSAFYSMIGLALSILLIILTN